MAWPLSDFSLVNTEINNPQTNECTNPVTSGHRFDKTLLCIKYPGNVINADKAIETLGGITTISTTVDSPNRRLQLRFRPDDAYSKPTCGDRHSTSGFLLRVRVKKNRNKEKLSEVATMNTIQVTSTDTSTTNINTTNLKTTESCMMHNEQNLSTSMEYEQVDNVSNTSISEDNLTNNTSNLVNQEQDCNVNSACSNIEDAIQKKCVIDNTKDLTDIDKTPTIRKKIISFDNNKYENLSQDTDYSLPCLKVLGRVDTEFKFTNLCDFQYVPMTQDRSNPEKLECIYSSIYPTNIPPFSWLKKDVPFFLPPAAFSRMDTVQQYVPKIEIDSLENKNKKCQAGFPNYIYFSTPEVPTTAPKGIEAAMKVKFLHNNDLGQVRQLFEERPIWSKNAIMYKTQFTSEQLKILLPSVAYYFMTGPWRIMWVKLGYDPRKDFNARKYQTLDYRLKAMHGLGSTVKCKRNYSAYTLPYKSTAMVKQKPAVLTTTHSQEENPTKKERHLHENVYIYREGIVPPSRQMFYQYCDVLVAEIQQMLAKLPDSLPGTKCHEKRGWLPNDFDVQCREIINKQVVAVLKKRMNIPEDHILPRRWKRGRGTRLKINKITNKKTKNTKKKSTDSRSNVASTSWVDSET